MANEFYTLIVVPHAKARFRKIQVSVRLTKWVVGDRPPWPRSPCRASSFTTRAIAVEVHELRQLRAENKALLSQDPGVRAERRASCRPRSQQLQNMVTKLGVMAGLEHSRCRTPVGGVGGVSEPGRSAPPRLEPAALAATWTAASPASPTARPSSRSSTGTRRCSSPPRPRSGRSAATCRPASATASTPSPAQQDFHPGIDISTPIGTKVQAPADGIVISTGQQGGYGNAIIDRPRLRRGHALRPPRRLRRQARASGSSRGDVIGFVGSTGRSTGPHLHYEVWVRDQAQNPIHFILDEYRSFG